jgi:hypothetical protein
VIAQRAVVLCSDAQQDPVDGLVNVAPAAALVGIHALVGDPERIGRLAGSCWQEHRAGGAADGGARRAR